MLLRLFYFYRNNLLLGLGVGLLIHYTVLLLMDNQPLLHAAEGIHSIIHVYIALTCKPQNRD